MGGGSSTNADKVNILLNNLNPQPFRNIEQYFNTPVVLCGKVCAPPAALIQSPVSSLPCVWYSVLAYRNRLLLGDKLEYKEVNGVTFYINGDSQDKLIKVSLNPLNSSISSDLNTIRKFNGRNKADFTPELQDMCARHRFDSVNSLTGFKSLTFFESKIMNGDIIKIVGYLNRNSDPYDTITPFELFPVSSQLFRERQTEYRQFLGVQSILAQLTIKPSFIISRKSSNMEGVYIPDIAFQPLPSTTNFNPNQVNMLPIHNQNVVPYAQVIATEPLQTGQFTDVVNPSQLYVADSSTNYKQPSPYQSSPNYSNNNNNSNQSLNVINGNPPQYIQTNNSNQNYAVVSNQQYHSLPPNNQSYLTGHNLQFSVDIGPPPRNSGFVSNMSYELQRGF